MSSTLLKRSADPPTSIRFFLALLFTVACRAATLSPTATAPPPTTSPPSATPAPTARVRYDAAAIEAVIAALEEAVLDRDLDAYLTQVDQSDPIFALEHRRWAEEWAGMALLERYALAVEAVQIADDTATATLAVTWQTLAADEPVTARFPVRFTRSAAGAWRYAGEQWTDVETEHFTIRVAPGTEDTAAVVQAALPGVYAHVTRSLDYVPAGRMQIKLYASVEALVATTLLSLPPIHGWNEPGEALKLYGGPDAAPELALAHEFTHFLEFDQAGTARSRLPWWLSEGLAVYLANDYAPSAQQREQISRVAEWAATGELADWDTLSVFETTPQDLWGYVYPQGYAFVTFITETYGVDQRNAWLRAMSTAMDLDEATPAVLGVSFEALDEAFRRWLAATG